MNSEKFIVLNSDQSIEYLSIAEIEINMNKDYHRYILIPISDKSCVNKYLILSLDFLITRFEKCIIKYRLRYSMLLDDIETFELPEVVLEPKNFKELYEYLHFINDIIFITEAINSDYSFDSYNVLDLLYFELKIKKSNLGNIHIVENILKDDNTSESFLLAECVIERLKNFYHSFDNDYSQQKIFISNDKWYIEGSIESDEDGIYLFNSIRSLYIFIYGNQYYKLKEVIESANMYSLSFIIYEIEYEICIKSRDQILMKEFIYDNSYNIYEDITIHIRGIDELIDLLISYETILEGILLICNMVCSLADNNFAIDIIFTCIFGGKKNEIEINFKSLDSDEFISSFYNEFLRQMKIIERGIV